MKYQQQYKEDHSKTIQIDANNGKNGLVDNRVMTQIQKKLVEAIHLSPHTIQAKFVGGDTVEGLNSTQIVDYLLKKEYQVTLEEVESLKASPVEYSTLNQIESFFFESGKKKLPPPPPPPPPPTKTKMGSLRLISVKPKLNVDTLFQEDKMGICEYDFYVTGEKNEEQGLMRMYSPEGKEYFVRKGNIQEAKTVYKWTTFPPRKPTKLFDMAKPCKLEVGISFIFICWKCGAICDSGGECDWVVHDDGVCQAPNILCFGAGHTHRSQEFKSALLTLSNLTSEMSNIERKKVEQQLLGIIHTHPESAHFYGFDEVDAILHTRDLTRWLSIKKALLFVHECSAPFCQIMDYLLGV